MGVSEDDLLFLEADVDAEVEAATNEAKAGEYRVRICCFKMFGQTGADHGAVDISRSNRARNRARDAP